MTRFSPYHAVRFGTEHDILSMLKHGADVDFILLLAVQYGRPKVAKLAINEGADITNPKIVFWAKKSKDEKIKKLIGVEK